MEPTEAPDPGEDLVLKRARARVGQTLRNKWHLDELLGVGGMAAVYAATHRNGRRGAVKVLHAELSIHEEIRGRFLREGLAANKVKHPSAVEVLDDDATDDGAVFLVMELLEGELLQARSEREGGRLSPDFVLLIADTVLDVLSVAHAEGIIHRDIKPENVFISHEGQVKLLDFGIARVRELSTRSLATRAGSMLGTPSFMPPEQALGHVDRVDAQSDLWSVGAMMFTLLVDQLVHEGCTTVNEVLIAAATKPARSLGQADPSMPAAIVQVVDRALAFDKADRWPDAQSMQQAVRDAYRALYGELPSDPRPTLAPARLIKLKPAPVVTEACTRVESGDRADAAQITTQVTVGQGRVRPRRRAWLVVVLIAGIVAVIAITPRSLLLRVRDAFSALTASRLSNASNDVPSASASAASSAAASDSAPAEPIATQPRVPREMGRVSVTVRGGACEVLVNGQGRGQAPVFNIPTPAGENRVTCISSKGPVATKTVRVKPNETLQVPLVLPPVKRK
jgi:eukaryotic-like serine/threonine-protein kinase